MSCVYSARRSVTVPPMNCAGERALHDEVGVGRRAEVFGERDGDVLAAHGQTELRRPDAGDDRAARDRDAPAAERARQRMYLRAVGREAHRAVHALHGQPLVVDERGDRRVRDGGESRHLRRGERAADFDLDARDAREEVVAREAVQDAQIQVAVHGEILPAALAERGRAAEDEVGARPREPRPVERDLARREADDERVFGRQRHVLDLYDELREGGRAAQGGEVEKPSPGT